MRLGFLFSLVVLCFQSQPPATGKSAGLSAQLELGWYSDFYYTAISPSQMQQVTGVVPPIMTPAVNQRVPGGHYSSIDAPYFTALAQSPFSIDSRLSWAAGASYYERPITAAFITSQTITGTDPVTTTPGNTLTVQVSRTEEYASRLKGWVVNVPLGLGIKTSEKQNPCFQAGLNLAPGLAYAHTLEQTSSVYTVTTYVTEREDLFYSYDRKDEPTPDVSRRNVNGAFFTAYAGLPLQAFLRLSRRMQFSIGLEPGYTFLVLGKVVTKSNLMARLGFGLRYGL